MNLNIKQQMQFFEMFEEHLLVKKSNVQLISKVDELSKRLDAIEASQLKAAKPKTKAKASKKETVDE